jgi:hypothetical protein
MRGSSKLKKKLAGHPYAGGIDSQFPAVFPSNHSTD